MMIMCTITETENRNPFIKMLLHQISPGVLCLFFVWLYRNPVPTHPIAASTSPSKKKTGERAIGGRRGMGGVGVLDFGL